MLLTDSISEFSCGDAIVETALSLYLSIKGDGGSWLTKSYFIGDELTDENFRQVGVHRPEYFYSIRLMIK